MNDYEGLKNQVIHSLYIGWQWRTLCAITLYGQCCRCHVAGQPFVKRH